MNKAIKRINSLKLLELAETVVEEQGDYNWFCEHYSKYREYFGIVPSLEKALEQQDLYAIFKERASSENLLFSNNT